MILLELGIITLRFLHFPKGNIFSKYCFVFLVSWNSSFGIQSDQNMGLALVLLTIFLVPYKFLHIAYVNTSSPNKNYNDELMTGEHESDRTNISENESEGDFRFLQKLLEGNLNKSYYEYEQDQRAEKEQNYLEYTVHSLLNVFDVPDEDQRPFDGFFKREMSDEEALDHRDIERNEMEDRMAEDISFVQQLFPPRRRQQKKYLDFLEI
jgi:hypothetical protein